MSKPAPDRNPHRPGSRAWRLFEEIAGFKALAKAREDDGMQKLEDAASAYQHARELQGELDTIDAEPEAVS